MVGACIPCRAELGLTVAIGSFPGMGQEDREAHMDSWDIVNENELCWVRCSMGSGGGEGYPLGLP